ncbi:hypothetical protein LOB98_10165, partial [Lactobacillus delbrueckii subsp. lactis]
LNYVFTASYYWQLILQGRENEAESSKESKYPVLRAALTKDQLDTSGVLPESISHIHIHQPLAACSMTK